MLIRTVAATTFSRRALLAGVLAGCSQKVVSPDRRTLRAYPLVYDGKGRLFIEARVNDLPPVSFCLATGSLVSVLSRKYATTLNLDAPDAGRAIAQVELPGLLSTPIDFVLSDEAFDKSSVGILGYDLLRQASFQIQYAARRLVWSSATPWKVLPMALDHGVPRIVVRLNDVPIDVRIDTGAATIRSDNIYVNLSAGQADEIGLRGEPIDFVNTSTNGDATKLPVYAVKRLDIGYLSFRERAFAIVQPREGYFARPDAVGFLGNCALDKVDPYFDYEQGIFGIGS